VGSRNLLSFLAAIYVGKTDGTKFERLHLQALKKIIWGGVACSGPSYFHDTIGASHVSGGNYYSIVYSTSRVGTS